MRSNLDSQILRNSCQSSAISQDALGYTVEGPALTVKRPLQQHRTIAPGSADADRKAGTK